MSYSTTDHRNPDACPTSSSRRAFWLATAIALVTFAVFYPVLKHGFVFWDDDVFILKNADLDPPTLSSLARFWGNPLVGYKQFLVPLNYTVWWALAHVARIPLQIDDRSVLIAPAFHAVNLGCHVAAAALAFLLLRKLVKSDVAAAVGALFFALHPLQAEPVSWAANMYTTLSGALALAALYAYLCSSDPGRGFRARVFLFALGTLCYVLGLLSKPSIVLLPLIAVTIELLLRGRRLRACAPLAVWLLIGVTDAFLTHHIHSGAQAFPTPFWQRPFVAADALTFYLGKALVPLNLIPDYGRTPVRVLQHKATYLVWLAPVAALLLCVRFRRRLPWLLCGMIVFVLGVLPMLGLAPFDFQGFSTVADRYLYLSLFGGAILVAFATRHVAPVVARSRLRATAVAAPLVVLVFFAAASRKQVNYWEDTGTLFHHTLAVNPNSEVAHLQLGYVLMNRGGAPELEEALDHYLTALEFRGAEPPLLCNLSVVLRKLGKPAEAVPFLAEASRRAPAEIPIAFMLADTRAEAGDLKGAVDGFSRILQSHPGYADAELHLARLLAQAHDSRGAAAHYRNYLAAHPTSAEARAALSRKAGPPLQAATDGR